MKAALAVDSAIARPAANASAKPSFNSIPSGNKKRAPCDARQTYHETRRDAALERVHHADRDPLQGLAGEAVTHGVLAIGGDAMAARAKIVVCSRVVLLAGV